MIQITEHEVYGWDAAIRGMRNPMNSWSLSDSKPGCKGHFGDVKYCFDGCDDWYECHGADSVTIIGERDLDLMHRLVNAGSDHRKFLRFITVAVDINAPFYWWKEYDTYKIGTTANSCSTMHKVHAKEFTVDDFSHEHLNEYSMNLLRDIVHVLNNSRNNYVGSTPGDKEDWWQIIQLLPTSYNQKRTVMLNYEVLRNMYHARKAHKLDEWVNFCKWVESLPYAALLITDKEGTQ